MKFKYIVYCLSIFIIVLIVGCNANCYHTPAQDFFQGTHELKSIGSYNGVKGEIKGSFFLGSGDIQGSLQSKTMLKFCWKGNDGGFLIADVPVDTIKFVINDSITIPNVKFRWRPIFKNANFGSFMSQSYEYCVITCNSSQLPSQQSFNFTDKIINR